MHCTQPSALGCSWRSLRAADRRRSRDGAWWRSGGCWGAADAPGSSRAAPWRQPAPARSGSGPWRARRMTSSPACPLSPDPASKQGVWRHHRPIHAHIKRSYKWLVGMLNLPRKKATWIRKKLRIHKRWAKAVANLPLITSGYQEASTKYWAETI